jgi:hypothetical protein
MVRPRVYVETTIPSFYHDVRSTPDIVVRRVPAVVTPLELLGGSDETEQA